MAVQAQYPPSNVLRLNRNMQEVNDFSLQPQPAGGGLFLVQSTPHIVFSNGGAAGSSNQRMIGREMPAATVKFNSTTTTTTTNNNNSMVPFNTTPATISLQPQTTQLIDLAQLRNHQPSSNVISTGLRLSFDEQQQQLQHQQQGLLYNPKPSSLVSILSEDFASETKQQREEIDRFLHAQGEHLRRVMAEKQQRHYRALLGLAEESVTRRLREKEAEVEKVTRRQTELEACAAQLAIEAQQWQAKARAQEAIAASLQVQLQLQQVNATASWCDRGDDEAAVDGLAGRGGDPEDAESAYVDPERMEMVGPSCRACRRRAATVVVLPCRHLCACLECDRLAQACPLCFCPRSSSIEVYLS